MRITEDQVEAACKIAASVYDGATKRIDGIEVLATRDGINRTSASDFINDYRCLMEGRVFQRAMSAAAMRRFMEQIFSTRQAEYKRNSVMALNAHIAYYEGHYRVRMHAMRQVAEFFASHQQRAETFEDYESTLAAGVARSLKDSREERLARLRNTPEEPNSRTVSVTVFDRNPDVIVEVLARASGKCERCSMDAPFLRARNGAPYLEVHHKVRLADGGKDSVSNAVALCPNCHRRAHYGAEA